MTLFEVLGPLEPLNSQVAHSHKAILYGGDDLLTQSVGSFLEKMNWIVVRVSKNDDAECLIEETERVHPEVVVLCQKQSGETTLPWRLIDESLCPKVLTIGLDSNFMHVYSKQDILLQGASDLLSIIDPGNFSNSIPGKEGMPDNHR